MDDAVKRPVPASSASLSPHRLASAAPSTNVDAPTMVKMLTAHDSVADDAPGKSRSRSGNITNAIESVMAIWKLVNPTAASTVHARRIDLYSVWTAVISARRYAPMGVIARKWRRGRCADRRLALVGAAHPHALRRD